MKFKINNKYLLGSASLWLLSITGLTSCTDELSAPINDMDLSAKTYATVSVGFGSSEPVVVSRAVDFDGTYKVDSYWVGLFDSNTHEILGYKYDEKPRKADGTRFTLTDKNSNSPFKVEGIEIYYYDSNPNAYIVGVVNCNNIKARNVGDDTTVPLVDLLNNVKKLSDINAISIDTKSATEENKKLASDESCPLLMGYFATTNNEAGRLMAHPDGSIELYHSDGYPIDDNNMIANFNSPKTSKNLDITGGAIVLRRLLADITVNVVAGEGVVINNLEYRVINNPNEVFLVEHIADEEGAVQTSLETYLKNTANSADYLTEGYFSDDNFIPASKKDKGFSFAYQAYENKHWGREQENLVSTAHSTREKKYDSSIDSEKAVFVALNQDPSKAFNNNAAMMLIKAEVSIGKDVGVVYYTIHEGFASNLYGDKTDFVDRNDPNTKGLDFQRFRDTKYTYTINIKGLNSLDVSVEDGRSDGISGTKWEVEVEEVNNPVQGQEIGTLDISSADQLASLQWRFYYSTIGREYLYGNWEITSDEPTSLLGWSANESTQFDGETLPESFDDYIYCMIGDKKVTLSELKDMEITSLPLEIKIYAEKLEGIEGILKRGLFFCFNESSVLKSIKGFIIDDRIKPQITGWNAISNNTGYYDGADWVTSKQLVVNLEWTIPTIENNIEPVYYMVTLNNNTFKVDNDTYKQSGPNYISYPYSVGGLSQNNNHTVSVVPYFDETIYKPGEAKIFWLKIAGNPSWSFSDNIFNGLLISGQSITDKLEVAGLSIIGGEGFTPNISNNYKFIQTGGGSVDSKCFKLRIDKPGKITVNACTSAKPGSVVDDQRSIYVEYSDKTDNQFVNKDYDSRSDFTFDITDIDQPTEISIYAKGGSIRFYSIEFEKTTTN